MTDEQTPDPDATVAERLTALDRLANTANHFLGEALSATDANAYRDGLMRATVSAEMTAAVAAVEQARALHRIADVIGTVEAVTHVTINNDSAPAGLPPVITEPEHDEQPARIDAEEQAKAAARSREQFEDPLGVVDRGGYAVDKPSAAATPDPVEQPTPADEPTPAATPDRPRRKPSA